MDNEVGKNRRATYRVTPAQSSALGIQIEIGGETTAARRIVDVAINGDAALLPMDALPGMETGDAVRLWVDIPGRDSPILVEATLVAERMTDAGDYQCSFRFDRSDELGQLSEEIYSLLNRRYSRRLSREELDQGLRVALEFPPQFGDPVRYHVGVKDLSLTGAAILANGDLDQDLADTEFIKLFITTPNRPEPLCPDARIRYRAAGTDISRYGIKIDIRDSADYAAYAAYAAEPTNCLAVAA